MKELENAFVQVFRRASQVMLYNFNLDEFIEKNCPELKWKKFKYNDFLQEHFYKQNCDIFTSRKSIKKFLSFLQKI